MSIEAVSGAPAVAELGAKPPIANQPAAPPSKPATDNFSGNTAEAGEQEVANAARSLDEVLSGYNISLEISRDDQTGATVVKLVDYQSGETLRQFPSEVSLHLTAMFGKLQGKLLNRQA